MIARIGSPSNLALVVEDSVVNQKLLTHLMTTLGFEVTLAENGEEAVDKFGQQAFDVILMDVQMPVMDGLTATRVIRHREHGRDEHTPIIAVTAGVDRQSCLEAGMDEHMHKPVRLDDLRLVLDDLMTRSGVSH